MSYKYAEILSAMAERAKVSDTPWDVIQWRDSTNCWNRCKTMGYALNESLERRVNPRTILIGSREVSEPLRMVDVGEYDTVFYPSFGEDKLINSANVSTSFGTNLVCKGMARRTAFEALELAEALLEVANGQ